MILVAESWIFKKAISQKSGKFLYHTSENTKSVFWVCHYFEDLHQKLNLRTHHWNMKWPKDWPSKSNLLSYSLISIILALQNCSSPLKIKYTGVNTSHHDLNYLGKKSAWKKMCNTVSNQRALQICISNVPQLLAKFSFSFIISSVFLENMLIPILRTSKTVKQEKYKTQLDPLNLRCALEILF